MRNRELRAYGVAAGLLAAAVALAGCKPLADTGPAARGDVVVSSGTSTHKGRNVYHVDCGRAGVAEYRVTTSKQVSYNANVGDPCPAGPHEPLPREKHPQLYREMSRAMNAPMPYHGGDPDAPCGSWGAMTEQDAAQMRAAHQRCQAQQEGGNTR